MIPAIRAGKLRHVISIAQPDLTGQDARGNPTETLTVVGAGIRASIDALSGRELYTAQQRAAQVTHRVVLRWPGFTVTPEMVVQFGARTFDILFVNDREEQHRRIELDAKERL